MDYSKFSKKYVAIDTIPASLPSTFGIVYIVKSKRGLLKIGMTTTPRKRIRTIETSTGLTLENIFISSPCTNYRQIEKLMHAKFDRHRQEGEWFKCGFDQVVAALQDQVFLNVDGRARHHAKQLQQQALDNAMARARKEYQQKKEAAIAEAKDKSFNEFAATEQSESDIQWKLELKGALAEARRNKTGPQYREEYYPNGRLKARFYQVADVLKWIEEAGIPYQYKVQVALPKDLQEPDVGELKLTSLLKKENERLRQENANLRKQIAQLKARLKARAIKISEEENA